MLQELSDYSEGQSLDNGILEREETEKGAGERQILHGFIYIWNIKKIKQQNKPNKNRHIDTENRVND